MMYPIYKGCSEEAIVDTQKEFYLIEFNYEYDKQEDGELKLKILDIYVECIKIGGGEGG